MHTNQTILFFHYCSDVAYYIMTGESQKAQDSFLEVEKSTTPAKSRITTPFLCSQGLYNETIGKNELALLCYDNVLQSIKQKCNR